MKEEFLHVQFVVNISLIHGVLVLKNNPFVQHVMQRKKEAD